jgi:hypothetical protein
MKKILLCAAASVFMLGWCATAPAAEQTNQPPTVVLSTVPEIAPRAPASILLVAEVSDRDGYVPWVEFFAGDIRLGKVEADPRMSRPQTLFQLEWHSVMAGNYQLTARAHDNAGNSAVSKPIAITIMPGTATDRPLVSVVATQPETIEPSTNTRVMPGVFTLSRTGPTNKALSVMCLLDGTADRSIDYDLDPAPTLAFLFRIPAGKTSLPIMVAPRDDALTEGDETVVIQLVSPPASLVLDPYLVDSARNQAKILIHDNDATASASIHITTPKAGDKYQLGQPIAIEATAIDPKGYINRVEFYDRDRRLGVSELIFIVAPQPGTPIYHSFVWTNAPLGEHVLTVQATRATGPKIVSKPVAIEVAQQETSRVVLDVVTTDAEASEQVDSHGIVDTAVFSIRRVNGPNNIEVPIFYSLRGSASNGVDYTKLTGQALLKSGQSNIAVVVKPIPDQIREGAETVVLRLEEPLCIAIFPPPPSCYEIKLPNEARAIIADATVQPMAPFVQRELPPAYAPGSIMTIELRVQFPDQGTAYAIEDRPPTGWKVSGLGDLGAFDPSHGLVKFGPFTDKKSRTLTYKVTPPVEANGRFEFGGSSSLDGKTYPIGGDQFIEPAGELHPADVSPSNKSIAMNELTAYAASWKDGKSWSSGPVPIPLSYVTRAGAIWKGGESYVYSPAAGAPPNCWVSLPSPRPLMVFTAGGQASRQLPPEALPGHPVDVHIQVDCAALTASWAVEEQVPAGFVVEAISRDGRCADDTRIIRWGPFFTGTSDDLSYRLVPVEGSDLSVEFAGRVSFDGSDQAIEGLSSLVMSTITPSLRIVAVSRNVDGRVHLRISGPIHQRFALETSSDLVHWFELTVQQIEQTEFELEDDSGVDSSMRYYRVQPR